MSVLEKQSIVAAELEYPPQASSGIAGLDELLRGGFPRDDLHLITGDAGSGKTTLALQFLWNGTEAGEPGLFITLAQSAKGLARIARSHGKFLDGIAVHELSPVGVAVRPEPQTVLHTADVELGEVTRGIREAVERVQPRRAVFDSLGALRILTGSPHRFQAEVLDLCQLLMHGGGCTTLFLSDPVDLTQDNDLQSLAGGVVHLQQSPPRYGEVRRLLRVVKMRGVPHSGGYHNFSIQTGGLEVYPRLTGYGQPEYQDFKPVKSGVVELDRLLGGGLEQGTACLFVGPAGSGKSTLAGLYVHSAARGGDTAALFLFEERPETFLARSGGVGIDLKSYVDTGRILIRQPDTATMSPGQFSQQVRETVQNSGAKVVVLDSLTGYFNAMAQEGMLVEQMHDLLSYLSRQGVMTILVITQEGVASVGSSNTVDISYLSDTIIVLRQFEAEGSIRRCIAAIKKRQGEHETTIRELMINPGGVSIGEPLSRFRNILNGDGNFMGGGKRVVEA